MTAPAVSVSLALPAPYSLAHTLNHVGMGGADPTLVVRGQEACWGLQGPYGPLGVYAHQRKSVLDIQVWGQDAAWLKPQLESMFGLQDQPQTFKSSHPMVARWLKRFGGMHLLRLPTFESRLMQVVLLQLVTWHDATRAWRALVRHVGERAPGINRLFAPPRMGTIATLPVARMVSLGLPYQHAHTLRRIARERTLLARAATLEPLDAIAALQRIRGVGPWTANYVLGTVGGFSDAELLGDLHLPNAVTWWLEQEARADDARMLEALAPFRPHRFRIVRYLWASGAHAPRRGAKLDRGRLGHTQGRLA